MKEEHVAEAIADLVGACRDAEDRFLLCVDQSPPGDVQARFQERVSRARQSASLLQDVVDECGGCQPVRHPWLQALRHGWLLGRARLTGEVHDVWLRECSHAEVALLRHFRILVHASILPEDVQFVVDQQFYAWRRVHDEIRALQGRRRIGVSA